MSGGAFNYAYTCVRLFAEKLDLRLQDEPETPEVHAALVAVVKQAEQFADVMRAVEWYYSGDTGEDSLLRALGGKP